jgi:hypothetical protein
MNPGNQQEEMAEGPSGAIAALGGRGLLSHESSLCGRHRPVKSEKARHAHHPWDPFASPWAARQTSAVAILTSGWWEEWDH